MYITNTISVDTLNLLDASPHRASCLTQARHASIRVANVEGEPDIVLWFDRTLGGRWKPWKQDILNNIQLCEWCRTMAWTVAEKRGLI